MASYLSGFYGAVTGWMGRGAAPVATVPAAATPSEERSFEDICLSEIAEFSCQGGAITPKECVQRICTHYKNGIKSDLVQLLDGTEKNYIHLLSGYQEKFSEHGRRVGGFEEQEWGTLLECFSKAFEELIQEELAACLSHRLFSILESKDPELLFSGVKKWTQQFYKFNNSPLQLHHGINSMTSKTESQFKKQFFEEMDARAKAILSKFEKNPSYIPSEEEAELIANNVTMLFGTPPSLTKRLELMKKVIFLEYTCFNAARTHSWEETTNTITEALDRNIKEAIAEFLAKTSLKT